MCTKQDSEPFIRFGLSPAPAELLPGLRRREGALTRDRHSGAIPIGGPDYFKDLENAKVAMVLEAVADSTCRVLRRGLDAVGDFLQDPAEAVDPQRGVGQHRGQARGRGGAAPLHGPPGTVKQRLFGIEHQHVALGARGPLASKPRAWLALRGLARR